MKKTEIKRLEIRRLRFTFKVLILLFSILYSLFSDVYGAFREIPIAPRYVALGRGGCAIVDDAGGININPAGGAFVKKPEVLVEYYRPYLGLKGPSYTVEGFHKVNIHSSYISYVHPISDFLGTVGISWLTFISPSQYMENTVSILYSRTVNDITGFSEKEDLNLGIVIKILERSFKPDDYTTLVFSRYGKSAIRVTLDLGAIYRYNRFSVGGNFRNLLPPDIGLLKKDKIPFEMQIGGGYNLDRYKFSLDFFYRDGILNPVDILAGGEFVVLNKFLKLRAGVNFKDVSFGWGLSFLRTSPQIKIDYAFSYPYRITGSYGSHRIGITLMFGKI